MARPKEYDDSALLQAVALFVVKGCTVAEAIRRAISYRGGDIWPERERTSATGRMRHAYRGQRRQTLERAARSRPGWRLPADLAIGSILGTWEVRSDAARRNTRGAELRRLALALAAALERGPVDKHLAAAARSASAIMRGALEEPSIIPNARPEKV